MLVPCRQTGFLVACNTRRNSLDRQQKKTWTTRHVRAVSLNIAFQNARNPLAIREPSTPYRTTAERGGAGACGCGALCVCGTVDLTIAEETTRECLANRGRRVKKTIRVMCVRTCGQVASQGRDVYARKRYKRRPTSLRKGIGRLRTAHVNGQKTSRAIAIKR